MTDSEFDVIKQYFTSAITRDDVAVGIGDDCALLDVPKDKQLVTTTDTLISGVHFPEQTSPEDIAYKSVAVNLSDLAAMGAEPAWVTLALTLPTIDHDWLKRFSSSFQQQLKCFNVQLIGGDTTKGALSITIHAMGFITDKQCMLRSNAKSGDRIYVSGSLGDAALGLMLLQDNALASTDDEYFVGRLNKPQARVMLGHALAEFSQCAIDISDGLFADLGHILESSHCGAEIVLNKIPVSIQMKNYLSNTNKTLGIHQLMTGDDYELCFTVSEENEARIKEIADNLDIPLSCIGVITQGEGITFMNNGKVIFVPQTGFDHF